MSKPEAPIHSALSTVEFEDGVLLWGNQKVSDIADNVGQTPFYAYDRERISQRIATLRQTMPDRLMLHYAIKANPMPEIVDHVAKLVDGLDVASGRELQTAQQTATAPHDISFAGPGKRDDELTDAVKAGITINIESVGEMRRISGISDDLGTHANIAIRVNPAFELKTAGMKMGGRPSQFGIDAEQVPEVLAELKALDLGFRGFHVFSGSQNLRAEAICESLEKTVELVVELASAIDLPVSFVNLGGGLGIPYFPKETPLDLAPVADAVDQAIDRLTGALGNVEPIMELGRYLVGEAGIYVTRVVDIKHSRGSKFAVCDGGMHHHLAASGNFGQIIRKNYPILSVDASTAEEEVSVVGPLCTPLDLLGDRVTISGLEVGSLVAVLQSGAYGATASPTAFLSHPGFVEVVV
ncbi:MAG: pyridoxal-dependent decarboxylase, exosortase A system-associated [Pseudomonadota bacterium]